MSLLGEKIKELRKENDITQAQLGALLGMSQKNISAIETGKINVDIATLQKISNIFGVSLDYFLEEKELKRKVLRDISPEETNLILEFRLMPRKKQLALLELIKR